MTKPVTAADVIAQALLEISWSSFRASAEFAEGALREACGGGDIIIRTDGTLWRTFLEDWEWPDRYHGISIVPVVSGTAVVPPWNRYSFVDRKNYE